MYERAGGADPHPQAWRNTSPHPGEFHDEISTKNLAEVIYKGFSLCCVSPRSAAEYLGISLKGLEIRCSPQLSYTPKVFGHECRRSKGKSNLALA